MASDWPFDDMTVFMCKIDGKFRPMTGIPQFAKWLMTAPFPVTFFAANPRSKEEQKHLKESWLGFIDKESKL